jgi:hypothetical protein
LDAFRISATSSEKQSKAAKIGVKAEHILSLREQASTADLTQLRSIYLEKVFWKSPPLQNPEPFKKTLNGYGLPKGTARRRLFISPNNSI